jgi:predicted enzyme related to lactoylglutathione lyase
MTDPLDALRTPVEPVDPDPAFASRLREQLRRAVLNPSGGDMTETVNQAEETGFGWPPALNPYIVVSDARRALDWYVEVFGATRRGELHVNADGTIGHAEVGIGDAALMFAEASDLWPDVPVAPPPAEPSTHSHTLHLQVDDVEARTEAARRNGAVVEREPTDAPYGQNAVIVDPFGHRWILLKPPAGATRHVHGDISYVTMVVADDDAAKRFYGAVLGWEFEPGSVPGAWGPVGKVGEEFGIWGDPSQRPEVQLCYTVRDIAAAVDRVRDAGGQADEIERKPYGLMVNCVDNQGAHFQLWQPA